MIENWFVTRVLVAAACGFAVGVERYIHQKPAGIRTNILIAVGAAIFTYGSLALVKGGGDPSRVAAQIVTGIGFLGAGTIMRHGGETISGLTTAASVWVVAAVGMLAGAGLEWHALGGTALTLALMHGMTHIESWIDLRYQKHTIELKLSARGEAVERLRRLLARHRISIDDFQFEAEGEGRLVGRGSYTMTAARRERLLSEAAALEGVESVADRPY